MKKLLSYLYPFTLKKYSSAFSGKLEVNMVNGRKMLDTATTNYSYGSLQHILHHGLKAAGFDENVGSVLVLGMGGGSVVVTIRDDFGSKARIQLVDIDPAVISIAKIEFNIMQYGNIDIAQADAAEYIAECRQTYDIIVVDLFIIDTVPDVFTQPKFISEVCTCVNRAGRVVFNTMRQTMPADVLNRIKTSFLAEGLTVKILENIEHTNDLVIAEKSI